MKKHTVNIPTPEVTDVTDNVAGLATFGFSYLKNAVNGVTSAIGKGVAQAKQDASEVKERRVYGRLIRNEVEIEYDRILSERLDTFKKMMDNHEQGEQS